MVDYDRLLSTFLELISIPGPSYEEAQVAATIEKKLSQLGVDVHRDEIGNLIGFIPGEGEPILLNAHMDTVEPCRNIRTVRQGNVIRSDGSTILAADDRAGIAAILEALEAVVASGAPHLPIELVFTVREEVGLQGAKSLDYSRIRSKRCIALDAGGPVGEVVTSAPAQDVITATIIGRSAHAGVAPEDGINAIAIAAEAISCMPLGRIDFETTSNIGVINGGRVTNIVPDRCEIKGEARSRSEAKLVEQTRVMVECLENAAKRRGGRVDIDVERAYSAYSLADEHPLVRHLCDCLAAAEIACRTVPTGGGSDVNIFNERGIAAVNFGHGSRNPHTTTEELDLTDMAKATEVLASLLLA